MDRRQEILLAERLDEVAEDPRLDGTRNELVLAVGSQHDDRYRALVEDSPRGFDPVQSRHLHVEHLDLRLGLARERDGLFPVARFGTALEPRPFEQGPEAE